MTLLDAGSCPVFVKVRVYSSRSPATAGVRPARLLTVFVLVEKSGAKSLIAVVTTPGK